RVSLPLAGWTDRPASASSTRDEGSGETSNASTSASYQRDLRCFARQRVCTRLTWRSPGRSSATLALGSVRREADVDETAKGMVAEFVATFALILIGGAASILAANGQLDLTGVALAHGLVLAIMVSITAHISGGLVNPAVAIGLWVTG